MKKGFTMLELMMTIVIIVSLSLIFINTFPAAQRRANDARRRSDLKQYQSAIEQYANSIDSFYPAFTNDAGTQMSNDVCIVLGRDPSANDCPEDVQALANPGVWPEYRYESNGTSGALNATSYVMWAQLESKTNTYFVVCSNGKAGETTGDPLGNDGVCPTIN